jgi:hypothetical protein
VRKSFVNSLAVAAVAVALVIFAAAVLRSGLDDVPASGERLSHTGQVQIAGRRPAYRYAVVAGGVYTRPEVVREVSHDQVVATHYAGIHIGRLRPSKVRGALSRYVSFRKDDRVYWTRRPVTLHAGETVLTDNSAEIRARCGNRLSDTPRRPTLPAGVPEPSEAELDQIEADGNVSLTPAALVAREPQGTAEHLRAGPSAGNGRGDTLTRPELETASSSVQTGYAGLPVSVFSAGGSGIPPEWLTADAARDGIALPLAPEALRPGPPVLVLQALITPEAVIPNVTTVLTPPGITSPEPSRPERQWPSVTGIGAFGSRQGPEQYASYERPPQKPAAPPGFVSDQNSSGRAFETRLSEGSAPVEAIPEAGTSALVFGGLATLVIARLLRSGR